MPRAPRSARSDGSDGEDGMQEMELQKLQRQYRIMAGDRAAYTEEAQNTIRKQKSEIGQLELEKQELLKELRLAESRSNQIMDEDNTETLCVLADAQEEYVKDKEEEKKKAAELDAKIREWERKIRQQHRNMGGVHMSAQHTVQTQKTLRTLENRLDQAKCKFNSILTENSKMRDEIESIRSERAKFEQIHKKLDKELTQLRKQRGQLVDEATQDYEARDEAQQKMIILKEKADKDLQQHNAEMKELLRIIDNDNHLRRFMGIKGQERQEDPQLVAWRQRKEALETERKKESQEDSVETYEAAFERIKEMTGCEDLNLLVNRFIETEDTNFALFNYVNNQNNEIEALTEEKTMIATDIEKFKLQGIEMEQQRKKILKELEDKQIITSKEADEYEKKHTEISKILDQLRRGIESLFNKINCDRSAIDDMLGAAKGVTDSNMIQYLGIIEQRTNELLAIQTYMTTKGADRYEKGPSLLGEGPSGPVVPLPIIPPGVGDEYESDGSDASEDEARPLTRNELQRRVMKTVKKRESAARKEGFRYDLTTNREKTKGKKDKK